MTSDLSGIKSGIGILPVRKDEAEKHPLEANVTFGAIPENHL
jgi:hypothetical protein